MKLVPGTLAGDQRRHLGGNAASIDEQRLRLGLVVLLCIHFILGVVFSLVVPLWEAYDETGHYAYVQYIANHFALPPQGKALTPDFDETKQPPLYYLIAGLSTFWLHPSAVPVLHRNPISLRGTGEGGVNVAVHGDDEAFPYRGVALAVHTVRIITVMLGTLGVWFTFCLARLVFPGRPLLVLSATAVAAFWPQFLFMSSVINNDGPAVTWSALVIWTTLRLLLKAVRLRDMLWPVASLCAGVLTKYHVLSLAPLVALGLGVGLWKIAAARQPAVSPRLLAVAAAAAIVFALGVSLYIRDLVEHQTSDVPIRQIILSVSYFLANPFAPEFGWKLIPPALVHGFFSFWALFGWGNLPVEDEVYNLVTWVSLAGLAGLVIALARSTRTQRISLLYMLGTLVAVVTGMTYLALFLRNINVLAGRYMLIALPAVSILLTVGVANLLPQRRQALGALALATGMLFWAVLIPFYTLMPAYAPPQLLPAWSRAAVPHPMQAVFGNELELIGYSLPGDRVGSGGTLPVTLFWRALKPIDVDYVVAVHLIRLDGSSVDGIDQFPGNGNYATSLWKQGTIIPDAYDVPVRVNIPELEGGAVVVSVYLAQSLHVQIPLKVTMPDGSVRGAVTFGSFRLEPVEPVIAKPEQRAEFRLNDEIQLVGYAMERSTQSMRVKLYWQPLRQPEHDYTRFVHLTNGGETLLAQQDGQPRGGLFPTSLWRVGDVVVDEVTLPLGAAATDQPLHLWVGMYQLENFQRLPVYDASGAHLPDDRIPIPLP